MAKAFIKGLRRKLRNLRSKRRQAHIHKLPNEVLLAIFHAGNHDVWKTYENKPLTLPTYFNIPFTVVVSHVSAHWRQLAINDPTLWTNIIAYSPRSINRAETYLQRSKECLLDINCDWLWNVTVSMKPLSESGSIPAGLKSIELLFPLAHRWRKFSFATCRGAHIDNLAAHLREISTPQLLCLRLLFQNDDSGGLGCPDGSFLLPSQCQRLRHLEINIRHPDDLPTLSVYQHVRAVSTTISTLILRGCVQSDQNNHNATIEVPSLRTLSIHGCYGTVQTDLVTPTLSVLSTPALESLSLHNLNDLECGNLRRCIEQSLTPKFPALRSLELNHVDIDTNVGCWLTETCPLVAHLTLSAGNFDNLLHLLSNPATPHWPELASLRIFSGRAFWMMDEHLVKKFVSTRVRMGLPLAELFMSGRYWDV
jgi:hypothetical protein